MGCHTKMHLFHHLWCGLASDNSMAVDVHKGYISIKVTNSLGVCCQVVDLHACAACARAAPGTA